LLRSEQTIEHQRTQAEKAGFKFDKVVWDEGVSGVSIKLAERPQGRLFDLLRLGDTLVVRWLDRLGGPQGRLFDLLRLGDTLVVRWLDRLGRN
jgi:putative DNA-invertase from lambdoid prophage Rac